MTAIAPPCERIPTADEIFGKPQASVPWPTFEALLALVVEVLPIIEDDLILDLVETLALALIDRDDQVRAIRVVLSLALSQSHAQATEIARLRHRLADLLDARRTAR